MAVKITKPRGTQDVLPSTSHEWLYVEDMLRKIVNVFGYKEIRLPTFEQTEVFVRGVGETTDVVGKEMYTFSTGENKDKTLTLRPEGTSGVVRAVLENGILGNSPMPFKAYYLQSCFRHEAPQSGRFREFHQLGIECFGTHAPESDTEVIMVAAEILKRAGIKHVRLELNSIGCKECRPNYHAALKSYFHMHEDKLCTTCKDRLERNPMRILDCKSEICQSVAKLAPVVLDYLCDDCKAHFEAVQNQLNAAGIDFIINPTIVRGLDYYSNTVFEFVHTAAGAAGTICGGGRYNGLVEQLDGPSTPAVGFGMGIERLMMVMRAENAFMPQPEVPGIFIANIGDAGKKKAAELVYTLRKNDVYAEFDIVGRGLKAQMKYADKLLAKYTLVLGDNEVETGIASIKNMHTGEQTEVSLNESLIEFLKQ